MLQKIRTMRIWQKLSLLLIIGGVPTFVLGFFFFQSSNAEIAAINDKLVGLDYMAPMKTMVESIGKHRGISNMVLSGNSSQRGEMADLQNAVENAFKKLDDLEQQTGGKYKIATQLENVRRGWQDVRSRWESGTYSESVDMHNRLLGQVQELIRIAGDNTGIITDPALDTYYLGNNILLQIPGAAESLSQAASTGAGIGIRGKMAPEERSPFSYLVGNVNRFASRTRAGMSTAFAVNPNIQRRLEEAYQASIKTGEDFLKFSTDTFIRGSGAVEGPAYFARATGATGAYFKLYDMTLDVMRETLAGRAARLRGVQLLEILVGLGAFLLGGALMLWVNRGVVSQVNAILATFSKIGMGDFEARAEVTATDELGEMAQGLNATLDSTMGLMQSQEEKERIQESIQKLLEEIAGLAEGDLTKEAEVTAEITGAIADSFNYMTAELRGIISKVQETTLNVSSSAAQVQTTAETLAQGSESQAVQIVEASAAIDEMAVSIQQVSNNAATAASVAEQALQSARQGTDSVQKTIQGMNSIRQQVQQTSKRMKRLGESSQEIGEIVQLIGDIADRTSILALNASIQAAMAGEAGKGFAVVAEEVERLAERSTEATKRISTLIKSIQTDTTETISAMEETTREVVTGSELANAAGHTLGQIESVSNQLAELIQSISMASKQQSRGSEAVAKSMADISLVTQQTAAGAKQAAISIRKLAEQADELRESLRRFRLPEKEPAVAGTGRWRARR